MANPTIADDPWPLFFVLYAVLRSSEKASLDLVAYRTRRMMPDGLPSGLRLRHAEAAMYLEWIIDQAAYWMPSFKVTLKPDGTVETFEYA